MLRDTCDCAHVLKMTFRPPHQNTTPSTTRYFHVCPFCKLCTSSAFRCCCVPLNSQSGPGFNTKCFGQQPTTKWVGDTPGMRSHQHRHSSSSNSSKNFASDTLIRMLPIVKIIHYLLRHAHQQNGSQHLPKWVSAPPKWVSTP